MAKKEAVLNNYIFRVGGYSTVLNMDKPSYQLLLNLRVKSMPDQSVETFLKELTGSRVTLLELFKAPKEMRKTNVAIEGWAEFNVFHTYDLTQNKTKIYHYFVAKEGELDGKSLCGRFIYKNIELDDVTPNLKYRHRCDICEKILKRRQD